MKKVIIALMGAALVLASCTEKAPALFNATFQMRLENENVALAGVNVVLTDGTAEYTAQTDAKGQVAFSVPAGAYTVTASGTFFEEGVRTAYNGSQAVTVAADNTFFVTLTKSVSSQIIIKELYTGGCAKNDGSGSFYDDKYIILYNNSESEVDASDIVFTCALSANAEATNKYYTGDKLLYESEDWIPAYSAIWWFENEVKIPAYSQIVVALFGAVDHTATYTNSVNLGKADYYWMSNANVTAFSNAKYKVSDDVLKTHYLTCSPINMGNAWVFSNPSPALYIGRMDKAAALKLSQDADNYDKTFGTVLVAAKFPKANVVDALEVWNGAAIEKSKVRFSADVNSGYVAQTATGQGYTLYRNVDKAATEALSENAGKLVYNYAGGTADLANGSTDPSGIDAEASIKAGAHIIYSDTNNSATDFHQRKVASLK